MPVRSIVLTTARSKSRKQEVCPSRIPGCYGGNSCPHGNRAPSNPKDSSGDDLNPLMRNSSDTYESDREAIQSIYDYVKGSNEHTGNYLNCFGFLFLVALYCAVLYLQANSMKTFESNTAPLGLLPDGLTGVGGFSFSSSSDIFNWLETKIVQKIWYDAVCGNSICERPDEFEAFGRFGCASDCGNNPNVSTITVSLTTSFNTQDELNASSWNLCLQDPYSLCWFQTDTNFTHLVGTEVQSFSIPDGNWTLNLNAPFGHVSGTVSYNGSYHWNSSSPVLNGASLVQWVACAPNQSETNLGLCRETAANLSTCFKGCSLNGILISSNMTISHLFSDFVSLCDNDPHSLNQFQGLDCSETYNEIINNRTATFENMICNGASFPGSAAPAPTGARIGRRLLEIAEESNRRIALAELNTSPSDYTSTIWSNLGSTMEERLFNLQVATQRALYTWVNNECLVKTPKQLNITARLSAFFCTYFGGPYYLSDCTYTNRNGTVLSTDLELALEMNSLHSKLNISRDQQAQFVDVFVLALQSVKDYDSSTIVAIVDRLRQLDTEIINLHYNGCPYVAQTLVWAKGRSYQVTIPEKSIVTWVWGDNEPHSVTLDDGIGQSPGQIFRGMGAGLLVVSRLSLCSTSNRGTFSLSGVPAPCILAAENGTGQANFKFSTYFKGVANYTFADQRSAGDTYGYIHVVPGSVILTSTSIVGIGSPGSSLDYQCSPGCALRSVKTGLCDPLCNNVDCGFDGGDCSCSPDSDGILGCSCPAGQTRGSDGTCCESFGVGFNLQFPFTVLTWGPNATHSDNDFLPSSGPPQFRFIGVNNRVLIGMLISQNRWANEICKQTRFFELYPNCTVGDSTGKFGVNPVFLPKSVLYNAAFAQNSTLYYGNYSLGYDNSTLRNPQGSPYGFEAEALGSAPNFNYFFDLNFNSLEAQESLRYLVDGFFIDNSTKSLAVRLLTFNGITSFFSRFKVDITFELGGRITANYDVRSIDVEPYSSTDSIIRGILEVLFVICLFYNVFEELKELVKTKKETGSFLAHFANLGNILDFLSISISLTAITLWIYMYVVLLSTFQVDARYKIYDLTALRAPGQYWDVIPPGSGFSEALAAFNRVETMVFFKTIYFVLNGINVLLMVMRLLKLMDFQPKMGTLTRTIANALPDLLHFFLVFFVTFFGFAFFGYIAFGNSIEKFRSIPASLVTLLSSLLSNSSYNDSLVQLTGFQLFSAILFWWTFILIVVFVILNLLIAIIVEGFVKVKREHEHRAGMPEELLGLLLKRRRILLSGIRSESRLLRELEALGAVSNSAAAVEKQGRSHSGIRVVPIGEDSVDYDMLLGVFERNKGKRVARKAKKNVSPSNLAHALFNMYGVQSSDDGFESARNISSVAEGVDDTIHSIASVKEVLAALKKDIQKI